MERLRLLLGVFVCLAVFSCTPVLLAAPIGGEPTEKTPEDIAKAHLQANRADLAIDVLTKALAKTPNVPRLHYWLGVAYTQDKPELAEAEFRTVLQDDPDFVEAHFRIAELLIRKISTTLPKDKNLVTVEAAIKELLSAIKKNPLDTKVYYDVAALYVDSVQFREQNPELGFSEAMNVLADAQKRAAPDESRPYVAMGNTLTRQADFLAAGKPLKDLAPNVAKKCNQLLDDASANFRKAVNIDPHFLAALNRIAAIQDARDDNKGAVKTFEDHLAKLENPLEKATCLRWMAQYLIRGKDLPAAEEKLKLAIKTEPKEFASYLFLADVLVQRGFPGEAIKKLEDAVKENPNFLNAQVRLGLMKRTTSLAEAQQHFQAALDIPPGRAVVVSAAEIPLQSIMADLYVTAARQLGEILMAKAQWDEAILVFRRLATIMPNSAIPEFLVGQVYHRRGEKDDIEAAREHYENALRRDKTMVEPRVALADIDAIPLRTSATTAERAKILSRVIDQYELALESAPNNAVILDRLADLRFQLAGCSTPKDRTTIEKALANSKKAVELSPDTAAFRRRLAFLYKELGSTNEAVAEIKKIIDQGLKVIEKEPDNAAVLYLIGDLRLTLYDWQADKAILKEALDGFEAAVKKQPQFLQPYLSAALVLEKEKDYKGAAEWYKRLFTAAKGNASLPLLPAEQGRYALHAAAELAWIYCEYVEGQLPEAEKYAKLATELDANLSSLIDTIGWIHYKKGEFDQAVPFLRRAFKAAPTNATVGFHLGSALVKINNPDGAKEPLREALKNAGDDTALKDQIQKLLKTIGG